MMGYNTRESTAIRVTSDLYDACADAVEYNAHFWHEECNLPRTYQTWFQLTNLHVWLLLVRFRAFPTRELSQSYAQELINHFFIDAESRMRERFGVQTARLVKGYMRDMHMQQRGAILSLDEALGRNSDAFLAAALWRNLWGGGWGVVGGVKRKLKGIDRSDKPGNPLEFGPEEEEGLPDLAVDKAAPQLPPSVANKPLHSNGPEEKLAHVPAPTNRAASLIPAEHGDIEALLFAEHLATAVDFVRIQVERLAERRDEELMRDGVGKKASQLFTKIE
ncbi:Serine carboxypeptidase 3 [Tilletia horrida]|uniref:Serine carboxypeptidase 3 n=1 Tax=Tilletia horrida TaxID=155126 RepID=A0AAN6GE32_9BASI|nr:Serine carboxypeptidase 3 [Tilletia horrida]